MNQKKDTKRPLTMAVKLDSDCYDAMARIACLYGVSMKRLMREATLLYIERVKDTGFAGVYAKDPGKEIPKVSPRR